MDKRIYRITQNKQLNDQIYMMDLEGDNSALTRPGQFINISIDGLYLRRPISVCDYEDGMTRIAYKVVGKGTQAMAQMVCGDTINVLTGLGNGYDMSLSGQSPLLIGGGMGAAPLLGLARRLVIQDIKPNVILGFGSVRDSCLIEEFRELKIEPVVTTNDGSLGHKGFVSDVIQEGYSHIFTCGPEPMLEAVWNECVTDGQFSFEKRMGCGFGACMGCSCKTKYGNKRICVEGPVLRKEEIIW